MPATPSPSPPPPLLLKRRGIVLAASAVLIIAAGALTGAITKGSQQQAAEAQRARGESVDDRLNRLKGYRASLELQKRGLENKIAAIRAKGEGTTT